MKLLRGIALAATGILACMSSARAQQTYQPVGSRVIYGDGSTDFYYKVTNPSTGQQVSVTVFFYCAEQVATVETPGGMPTVNIVMACLNGFPGPVSVSKGGSVQVSGMIITVNPSSWTIARSRAGEYVVNSSINVPLTVQ